MEVLNSNTLLYGDSLFSTCLLQNIEGMRRSRTLCDVTLVVDKMEIMAHKVILAAASPYFRAMLCTDMKESTLERIDMQETEYTILEDIINFFYTAQIKIQDDNVYAVMELADFLQVSTLRKACSHYLESSLTASNCLSTYVRAGMRDYGELEHAAFRFILRNFQAVLEEEEFLHVPVDTLIQILDSRLLNVKDEGQVLECVIRWLKHDQQARLVHLEPLIDKVDLSSVPMEVLIAVKNDSQLADSGLQTHMTRAVSAILAERYDSSTAWISLYKRPLKKQRYSQEQEVLLAIGGESIGMAVGSVECFTLGYDKWKCVIPTVVGAGEEDTRVIPTMKQPRMYAAVVATDYKVFVVGGRDMSTTLATVETYSIQTNLWSALPPLPLPLQGAGAALVGGRLHVVGGCSLAAGVQTGGWALDPSAGKWRSLVPMSQGRVHAGVVSVGGSLYVFGGIGADQVCLSSAEKYDPVGKRWYRVAAMREPRARMGCVAIEEFVYVMGGHDGTFWLKSVERYNTLTNEWCPLSPMSVSRSDFSATVCDRRIYCLGGYDSIHHLNTVEKYNPRTDRWHCVSSMRHHRFALSSATLHVPLTSPGPI